MLMKDCEVQLVRPPVAIRLRASRRSRTVCPGERTFRFVGHDSISCVFVADEIDDSDAAASDPI
jgi:hypothetical protein